MVIKPIFILALANAALAFNAALKISHQQPSTTAIHIAVPENFERAVECSQSYGLCDVDELLTLAEDLESHQGAFFESEERLRAKEIKDRLDLAEVLRMEAELSLRHDYLEKANLFKEDVLENHFMKEREEFLDLMGRLE